MYLQDGLWWLNSDRGQHSIGIRILRFLALVGILAGLEGRVLLPSFGHYLGLHYPWNVVAISAALVGAGCLMLLHFEGTDLPATTFSKQQLELISLIGEQLRQSSLLVEHKH